VIVIPSDESIESFMYDILSFKSGTFQIPKGFSGKPITDGFYVSSKHLNKIYGYIDSAGQMYISLPSLRNMTQIKAKLETNPQNIKYHYLVKYECWAIQESILEAFERMKKPPIIRMFVHNYDNPKELLSGMTKYPEYFKIFTTVKNMREHGRRLDISASDGHQWMLHHSRWSQGDPTPIVNIMDMRTICG
jgi:hypothetical protein